MSEPDDPVSPLHEEEGNEPRIRISPDGTANGEVMLGSGEGEEIDAGDGHDVVLGGGGDDDLSGGSGNDWIMAGSGDDTVRGGEGNDFILGGSGDDKLFGGAGGDEVLGGSGNDTIDGGAGNDIVAGDGGDDTVSGGAGDDLVYGGLGDDTLAGGSGADTFVLGSGEGHDTITDFDGSSDRIQIFAHCGALDFSQLTFVALEDGSGTVIDLSAFGTGRITVLGINPDEFTAEMFELRSPNLDLPTDPLTGEAIGLATLGSEYCDVHLGYLDNHAVLHEGDDTADGRGGDDWLWGNEGDDRLDGGEGDDVLFGDEGDDVLDGGAGNDTLAGGEGADRLTGGAGADVFVYGAGQGNDTIVDFTDGEDAIDLTGLIGIASFSDLSISADGSAALIDLTDHGGGTIRLENFAVADLDAEDFRFYEPPVDSGGDGL